MFGAGCKGCNFDHDFDNVNINGKKIAAYMADKQEDVNYIEIEPVTGVMTKMVRSYTMVLSLYCYERNTISQCSGDKS